ncbi:type II toxin-antitoxin system RelE/ParE family toxin [Hahella sp. NBU794]|uniref:type II toxin-antitoxin system RelE/ParE family toxin n=1 Tax=Hahella sp. NBU794 TaxID=3422590 RepID=UPI003D6F78D8
MNAYVLTKDAENDLRDVARYTMQKWGKKSLEEYRAGLAETFAAIGDNQVASRQFSANYPQLRAVKYRFHYIFYLTEGFTRPVIIGVIHEKRDIVSRLSERLT